MLTLIKCVVTEVPVAKLLVGDVIATKGTVDNPMRLRRVDVLEGNEAIVSTPRNGDQTESLTFPKGSKVVVAGRVEQPTIKPKAAAKPRGGELPAPVKVTKTTPKAAKVQPIHAAADRVETITRTAPKAAPASSIRDEIRNVIREAVSVLIVTEVKALVAEALA